MIGCCDGERVAGLTAKCADGRGDAALHGHHRQLRGLHRRHQRRAAPQALIPERVLVRFPNRSALRSFLFHFTRPPVSSVFSLSFQSSPLQAPSAVVSAVV